MTKTSTFAIAAVLAVASWAVPALAKQQRMTNEPANSTVEETYANNYGSLADRQSFFYRQ